MSRLHYFESDQHYVSFIECVARRNVPLKFGFSGSAAVFHYYLSREDGYRDVTRAISSELAGYSLMQPTSGSQLCDLGPGTGMHTEQLIVARADSMPAHYLALDFSSITAQLAFARIQSRFRELNASYATWDFEAEPTQLINDWRADRQDYPLTCLLLGNILGNVEDSNVVLRNIWASLRPGDSLIASVASTTPGFDAVDYVRPYLSEVFRHAVLEPFEMAMISCHDVEFALRWTGSQVIAEATFPRVVHDADGNVLIWAGEPVRCFRSARFDVPELETMMRRSGYEVVQSWADRDSAHSVTAAVRR